ncbi:hypothetical protein BTVI_77771 [Pitangus sulphuratus]|nr:hypothetical protein BTVI_77771 [Pitangus sulphuratus]
MGKARAAQPCAARVLSGECKKRMKQWQVEEKESNKLGVTVENHYQLVYGERKGAEENKVTTYIFYFAADEINGHP